MPNKKITVDEAASAAKSVGISDQKVEEIKKALSQLLETEEDEKEPRVKSRIVAVTSSEGAEFARFFMSSEILVAQIPENEDPSKVSEKISVAFANYNSSKKGRKHPAKTLADLFRLCPARILKAAGVERKSKELAIPHIYVQVNDPT